jgi:hypothetical protein
VIRVVTVLHWNKICPTALFGIFLLITAVAPAEVVEEHRIEGLR